MDADLVVRARGGDRDAFAQLAAQSIGRLDASARLIIRDRERAKDIVQETLVRAWRSLPTLRDPERFEGWVRRLLVRSCVDELCRMRRHVVEIELTDLYQPSADDPSAIIEHRDVLRVAFRRLDPEQRSLLVLHYFLGLRSPTSPTPSTSRSGPRSHGSIGRAPRSGPRSKPTSALIEGLWRVVWHDRPRRR